jgi:hypothetical protein
MDVGKKDWWKCLRSRSPSFVRKHVIVPTVPTTGKVKASHMFDHNCYKVKKYTREEMKKRVVMWGLST